jgi:hypothetical protein
VSYTESNQSFGLDAPGRPRFIYSVDTYGVSANSYGMYYAYCDSACTNAANWFATQLTQSPTKNAALAFDPTSGLARIVWNLLPQTITDSNQLGYVECSTSDCASNTPVTLLTLTASHPACDGVYALRINSKGGLRLGLYPGTGTGGGCSAETLARFSELTTFP